MNNKVNFIVEVKIGRVYKAENTCTDTTEVYKALSNDIIAKKVNGCTYIKSIRREPLYNGYQRIIVTYDNKVRRVYTVESK